MTPREIIAKVVDEAKEMSRPAYRGQASGDWRLLSGAVDRLQRKYGDHILDDENIMRELVSDYHNDLLARMEVLDGTPTPDLQRLSILQHQGAATGLLDFTESPLVALWFACGDELDSDGKVFMLDIDDHEVANGRKLTNEDLIGMDRIVYYEPDRSFGSRIVAQQSVFVVLNPPRVSKGRVRSVVVPKDLKKRVTEYLGRLGVSERALFGDVPGLARANARHTALRRRAIRTPQQYRDQGNQAYRVERYEDALGHYKWYAAALPDSAEPHRLIGDTLSALGRLEEAIEAYTRAIERGTRPVDFGRRGNVHPEVVEAQMLHGLYYNRGNSRAEVGWRCLKTSDRDAWHAWHAQAVSDYDSALKHGSELKRNVLFNRGNSKYALERFAEAFEDFESAWLEREGSDVALALGNCKVMAGEFSAGLERYLDGVRVGGAGDAAVQCGLNAGTVGTLLEVLGRPDYEVRRNGHIVFVKTARGGRRFSFAGNRRNVGNTPSGEVAAADGKGFTQHYGFAVVTETKQD